MFRGSEIPNPIKTKQGVVARHWKPMQIWYRVSLVQTRTWQTSERAAEDVLGRCLRKKHLIFQGFRNPYAQHLLLILPGTQISVPHKFASIRSWHASLHTGCEISRHLSMLANKAQLESDFHLKRVPTILTIERREKRTKKERPCGRGGNLVSHCCWHWERELGQFLGQITSFHWALLNGFLNVCLEQELADKVHCRRPPGARYQRKIQSFVQPELSCSVPDAFEHLRRRQREENPPDQNVPPRIHVTRCAAWMLSEGAGKVKTKP